MYIYIYRLLLQKWLATLRACQLAGADVLVAPDVGCGVIFYFIIICSILFCYIVLYNIMIYYKAST